MRLRSSWLVVVLLVLALAAGCSSGGSGSSGGTGSTGGSTTSGPTIIEKGIAFSPSSLDVKVGDVVTFENQDSAPHNVSIDGKELGSQSQGQSVTWTATKAGTYPFSCTIHPSMTGEIVVK